jgi:hypothetical protein
MAEDILTNSAAKRIVEVAVTPGGDEEQRRRLIRIKRTIRRKSGGAISNLTVEVRGESLVIGGRCVSFYSKQVAQEACMSQLEGQLLVNEIEVAARPR